MKRCPSCRQLYDSAKCPICKFVAPSLATIRRKCEQIRKRWSQSRLRHDELYEELEIPGATRVTDHMRRRDAEGVD